MVIPVTWRTRSARLELPDGEVHLWRAVLDLEPRLLDVLSATLDPAERTRADRFVFDRDRNHFIAARGILRQLLGQYLCRHSAGLPISYGPFGKPALQMNAALHRLQFNLSHSHGLAVFAFAIDRELGVDVEAIRPEFAGEDIAERYFSRKELEELRALPPSLRAEGFFHCWTRKEAYIKARGEGLQIPLESFDVSLTPGKPESLTSSDASRWSLHSFDAAPGYAGAIVGEGRDWRPSFWEWTS